MLKRLLLAGLLAAVLMLSGCALIEMDEAVDAASVVITMSDRTFTKAEVNAQIENYYGDLSGYDAQYKRQAQEYVAEAMVQQAMMDRKVKEWGLDQLTAEEESQVKAMAAEAAAADRSGVRADLFADSELSEAEIDEAINTYLASFGVTEAVYEDYARTQIIENKLIDHVLGEITVSDAEIQAELDWLAENDQTEFAESLQAYEERVNAGETAYYTPAGYRYVKMIKRLFNEEDRQKVAESDTETIGQTKSEAYAHLEETMTEIMGRLEAGEDFDTLVAEYGQDPLAQAAPIKEKGYAVSVDSNDPSYEAVLAAMALAKPGDYSKPVKLSDGMAILKYEADIPEGVIALDAVKEDLRESVMSSKRDVLFYEQLKAWTEEANAKVDYDVLNR